MFENARVKLTIAYTLFFSFFIVFYSIVFFYSQRSVLVRTERQGLMRNLMMESNEEIGRQGRLLQPLVDEELRLILRSVVNQLLVRIIVLDIVAVTLCALVSYYLAGKTLEPIVQSFQRQRHFLENVSHELNTPLTNMGLDLELMGRSKSLSDIKKHLQSIKEEQTYLKSLLGNLSQLIFEDTPVVELIGKTNLSELIGKLGVRSKEYGVRSKDVSVELVLDKIDKNVIVAGQETDWRQLITIFIDNAFKYTSQGEVRMSLIKQNNKAKLTITDTGIGMSSEDQAHIFERFYKADKSRNSGGFGLGLSIASGLAEKLKVKIGVNSQINQGTTFTLTFPIAS